MMVAVAPLHTSTTSVRYLLASSMAGINFHLGKMNSITPFNQNVKKKVIKRISNFTFLELKKQTIDSLIPNPKIIVKNKNQKQKINKLKLK